MNLIFPIARVCQRLQEQSQRLKLVGVSADLATAKQTPPAVACAAYVVQETTGEKPQFSTGDDAYAQSARTAVQTVLWVRNYAQARTGAGARADMDALINEMGDVLVGFAPEGLFQPLYFGNAFDVFYDAGWLVSQVTFFSEFIIGR